jgi:hypothetical protein
MLVPVTEAHNEAEAEMICGHLAAHGIDAVYKRGVGDALPEVDPSDSFDILVAEEAAAAARDALATTEFSDAELSALSDRAAEPPAADA